jgi:hypothetical protein
MIWFLVYVSAMLAVWGYYVFREESEPQDIFQNMEPEAIPAVQETPFDRIRRMRELTTEAPPQYIQVAPQQPSLHVPVQLLVSFQQDIVTSVRGAIAYCNKNRDRYLWLAASALVVVLFIHTASKQQPTTVQTQPLLSWSELQPMRGKMLYDEAVAEQVSSKPVFQIVFKDYPKDRPRFIHEFTTALSLDEEAQRSKWQEMYLVMSVYHLRKYAGTAPDEEMLEYARATLDGMLSLYQSGGGLCQAFAQAPAGDISKTRLGMGRDGFTRLVKSIPALILAARTTPQALPDVVAVEKIKRVLNHRIDANRYNGTDNPCGSQLAYYEEVLKLPPNEASMVLRHDLAK